MQKWKVIGAIALVAIIAAGMYFATPYLNSSNKAKASTVKSFFVSLTDPSIVPKGTTALYVTYSQVQLIVLENGSESIVNIPGSGTVNVLTLLNSSIVIGTANLANGTVLKQIKFSISNATITINGVNDSVVIGEGTLTTNVTGTFSGTQAALVDLVPSITEIQTVDDNIFVLTPSVKSVLAPVGEFGQIQGPPQAGTNLGNFNNNYFGGFLNSAAPGVSITSASLVVNGNVTSLSITIKNTGNTSVGLMGLMLQGPKQLYFPPVNIPVSPPPLPVAVMTPLPPDRVVIFPNGTRISMSSYMQNNMYQPPLEFNLTAPLTTLYNNATGIYSLVPSGSTYAPMYFPNPSQTTTFMPPQPSVPMPVPNGTIILAVFPRGFVPPSSAPPAQQLSFMDQQPIGRFIYPNGTVGFPPMSVSIPTVQMPNSTLGSTGSNQFNVSVSMQPELPAGFVLNPGQSVTLTLSGELALGPAPLVPDPSTGQMIQVLPPFAALTTGQSYAIQIMTDQGPLAPYNITATS